MLTRRHLLAASAAGLLSARSASAQVVKRNVHLIVPFPAGGGTDVIARLLAERIRGAYAATVLVENKPGAAGRLAVEQVKNSEPDGGVLLFTPDFLLTVYPHSFRSLSYDPVRDLVPVGTAAKSMLTLNVGPAVPESVRTLADFVQWCKANPQKAAYATTAAGGTPHFVGVMLASASGVAMTPVHYRGGAPALQDLIGGHVPAAVNPISETLPYAKSREVRILAVTGAERSSFLPEVPTMREAGFDVTVEAWLGVFAPARTPDAIVQGLSAAMQSALASAEMRDSLARFGNEPVFTPPAQLAETVKADIERWRPVVKASGFVAED